MTAARWTPAAALLAGVLTLAPVWISPVLVTTDGPVHVYNAALARGVEAGRPPFATYFRLDDGGVRPNVGGHALVVLLGPWVGWETAERLLVTLAMAATFAVLVSLIGGSGAGSGALLVPLAAWLTTSWFVWMGFYDFILSVPCFAGLLVVLRRSLTPRRHVALQILLALLYLTHFFTFAAGLGLVVAVVGWRALTHQGSWAQLRVALPAMALLSIEMASGGPGAGSLSWRQGPWERLVRLVTGDFVVTAHPLDFVAGVTITAALGSIAALRWRAARHAGLRAFAGEEVFGLGLVVLSLAAPHGVGEGSFIPIRMRYLGVLTLVPAIADAAGALRLVRLAVPAAALFAALFAALVVHTVALVRDARRVQRDLVLIDRLLAVAGATEQSWVVARFTIYRRGQYRVAAYRNLASRVATRRHLVVLDNFEALYGIFPTTWRGRPDWIQFRPSVSGLTVRLVPGSIRWPSGIFVLHESDRMIQVADARLAVGPRADGGPFAVTLVRRVD